MLYLISPSLPHLFHPLGTLLQSGFYLANLGSASQVSHLRSHSWVLKNPASTSELCGFCFHPFSLISHSVSFSLSSPTLSPSKPQYLCANTPGVTPPSFLLPCSISVTCFLLPVPQVNLSWLPSQLFLWNSPASSLSCPHVWGAGWMSGDANLRGAVLLLLLPWSRDGHFWS